MTDIESLTEEEQYKVYWLSQYLYEHGIEGIHFTEEMLKYLESPKAERKLQRGANTRLKGKKF